MSARHVLTIAYAMCREGAESREEVDRALGILALPKPKSLHEQLPSILAMGGELG